MHVSCDCIVFFYCNTLFTFLQQKLGLIMDVVKVLGFAVALDLYHETARIQRNGGTMTNEGERRFSIPV